MTVTRVDAATMVAAHMHSCMPAEVAVDHACDLTSCRVLRKLVQELEREAADERERAEAARDDYDGAVSDWLQLSQAIQGAVETLAHPRQEIPADLEGTVATEDLARLVGDFTRELLGVRRSREKLNSRLGWTVHLLHDSEVRYGKLLARNEVLCARVEELEAFIRDVATVHTGSLTEIAAHGCPTDSALARGALESTP